MDPTAELDAMGAIANELDDLGNLFEFGDIDLNNIPGPSQYDDPLQQQHGTHPNTPFQDIGETSFLPDSATHDFGSHDQFQNIGQQQYLGQYDKHVPASNPYTPDSLYHPAVQQPYNPYSQKYRYHPQQGFPPSHHVPPTPNSYEMHGETGQFMQRHAQLDQQQRAIAEQQYHLRNDNATAFTPMVSPAGTPQYSILPEFTTPGAYFSPLTSPMLHGETQDQPHAHAQFYRQQRGYLTNPSTAPNSNTNSPMDPNIDIEMLDGITLPESAGPKPRKSKRKVATPRSTGASGRVKQSPAQNAQKRKSASLASVVPHSAAEQFASRAVASQPSSAGLQLPPQLSSSDAESISPDTLNESAMGPPPRPSAKNPSPAIVGQQQHPNSHGLGPAATPKSLLTARSPQQPMNGVHNSSDGSNHHSTDQLALEELSLPAAATTRRSRRSTLAQINTQVIPPATSDNTPRLSARKTPKFGPLSTPGSAISDSAVASPTVAGSPMTASTPSAVLNDKQDAKGTRTSKKGSTSANSSKLVSPALVPKVSPGIKPLLPEGSKYNA